MSILSTQRIFLLETRSLHYLPLVTRLLTHNELQPLRSFSASSNLRATRKTSKKYKELPTSFVLPDGSSAVPLSDWNGGLGQVNVLNEGAVLSQSDSKSEPALSERDGAEPPKKRRGRRKVVKETPEESQESTKIEASPKNALAVGVLENLAKFPHCILLTRVGQFYESYFDQAKEVSRLLGIKLTQRTWKNQRVWMCGFPLMHINKYLRLLVQRHHRFVAMCEEFPRDPLLGAKGGFERRVARIVTPGTLIDEPFLNPYENNYLLSIVAGPPTSESEGEFGLAWIDVSTGEFFTKAVPLPALRDELVRINPREVVLNQADLSDGMSAVRQVVTEEDYFLSLFTPPDAWEQSRTVSEDTSLADDIVSPDEPTEDQIILSDHETGATLLLTAFMQDNLREHMPELGFLSPSRESARGRMEIDSHTIKALEIREGISEGGTTGSLLSVVKRTVTSSGTRLLARWLCSPSTSLQEINARQSLVAFFHKRPFLRDDLVQALSNVEDTTRVVQKFLLGRGQASDLTGIGNTIGTWSSIEGRIKQERVMEEQEQEQLLDEDWASLDALMSKMNDLRHLSERIERALFHKELTTTEIADEQGEDGRTEPQLDSPAALVRTYKFTYGDNWTIKPEFSEELTRLHAALKRLLGKREKLEKELQDSYNAPSLTLRSSPGLGMHVHIARGKRDASQLKSSPLFVLMSESNSTKAFFYQKWSLLGGQIVDTVTSIYLAEKDAFESLRREVNAHSNTLRQNARIVDELDVTIAFANLAREMNLARPVLREDASYHVVNGRHPTVELGLLANGRVYTPNSVSLTPIANLHVVTGPNMAGKSTLLRQTALISILAQTGSFVPADSAEIGIVDRIFSRIGAKDDLFRDRSTFMVEMLETSDILRRATPNSLVIMDEVGRGTTVEDGLAVAFATVHHLVTMNRCRALFATHFHDLVDMLGCTNDHQGEGAFSNVRFYCTDVDETEDGYFAYAHRLRPGVCRDSHGLKVAKLAGLPDSTVNVAQAALAWLKKSKSPERQAHLRVLGQSLATGAIEHSP